MTTERHGAPHRRRLRRLAAWWADERGQVGNIEVLPFGLLLFVAAGLLVASAWAVVDARMTTSSAAREAARAYVEAPDQASAERQAAERAAEVVRGRGRDAGRLRIERSLDAGYGRCLPVTIRTSYEVPAIHVPWLGGFGHGITVTASHTELIDPYRSGVAGVARC